MSNNNGDDSQKPETYDGVVSRSAQTSLQAVSNCIRVISTGASTVVCVLDNFDGNSMKVAELLVDNGFKEAYYSKAAREGIMVAMVWCNHCGKNVSGIRPYDGALACDLCGRILENFNFSTEVNFANNAAGQNMPPPPATAMEAVQRMLDRKGLGRFIDYNVLEELFATRPIIQEIDNRNSHGKEEGREEK